jgi:hypothetical protein
MKPLFCRFRKFIVQNSEFGFSDIVSEQGARWPRFQQIAHAFIVGELWSASLTSSEGHEKSFSVRQPIDLDGYFA